MDLSYLRDPLLPAGKKLDELLDLKLGREVGDLVAESLIAPLQEFMGRPGKRIRGQMVELGFGLSGRFGWNAPAPADVNRIVEAARALEALHAGSLVVDDIQDESTMRRGEPCFHLRYGLSRAINAGNWLYFWPLERIREWGLEPQRELRLYQICVDALLRAHFGQALDVGVRIDSLPQERIAPVCLASLELKTGALMALGITIGAVLGGADDARLALLTDFGRRFGVALQMFDDLGNLRAKPEDPKRYEDLRLGRPSWVWASAAENCSAEEFTALVAAARALPDDKPLLSWLERRNFVAESHGRANHHLETTLGGLGDALAARGDFEEAMSLLQQMGERLAKSYV